MGSSVNPEFKILQWDNHPLAFVTKLHSLFTQERFVDVTLKASGGECVKVHRLILCAASQYFEDLFSEKPITKMVIGLTNVSIKDLQTIVEYIYQGKVVVFPDQISSLTKAASALKIKGLVDQLPTTPPVASTPSTSTPRRGRGRPKRVQPTIPTPSKENVDSSKTLPNTRQNSSTIANDRDSIGASKSTALSPVDEAVSGMSQQQPSPQEISFLSSNDHDYIPSCSTSVATKRTAPESSDVVSNRPKKQRDIRDSFKTLESADVISERLKKQIDIRESFKRTPSGVKPTPVTLPKSHMCHQCGRSYKHGTHLRHHLNNECQIEPRFFCPKCSFQAKRKDNYRQHLTRVHKVESSQLASFGAGLEEKPTHPFKCPKCDRTYKYKNNLGHHLKKECGVERKFACGLCDYRAAFKSGLRLHLSSVHGVNETELPAFGAGFSFLCKLCPFRGKGKNGLKEHMKIEHSES